MYPLTPMQSGMLFHAVSAPGTGVDVQHIRVDLDEGLDIERFRAAWEETAGQHQILRARFEWEGVDTPQQVFDGDGRAEIRTVDLTSLGDDEAEARVVEEMRADRLQGFDLTTTPNRFVVFERGDRRATLLWSFHHILLDGRSFPIVLRDVFAVYDEHAASPAPRPYADYLDHMSAFDHGPSGAFWSEHLTGVEGATPLVIDHAPPPAVAAALGTHEVHLDPDDLAALAAFGQRAGGSVNTLIQLGWGAVLHHYGGGERVTFGATRACRHGLDGLAEMVGVFINTVPMAVGVGGATPIAEALASLRSQAVAMRPHENTPLAEIARASDVPAGEALFHSLVVFENYELDLALRAQGGPWLGRHVEYKGQTNSPLTLMAYADQALRLRFEYDPSVLSAPMVERMAEHLVTFLRDVVHHDAADPVRSVAYLTEADRDAALAQPARLQPASERVADAIATRWRDTPDAVAVTARDGTLTYGELAIRAAGVEAAIRDAGVQPGEFVGVAIRRGVDLVSTMVGVMRSGAAFVPIDPRFPRDRIAHMVNDSGMRLVLTDATSTDVLPTDVDRVLVGSIAPAPWAPAPGDEPADGRAAYAIYTSGSTGLPKGVVVSHLALSNFMRSMAREPGLTAADRLLAVTTVSFDISILELFLPLMVGAQVVLADDDEVHDGRLLAERIDASAATVMQATPTTWRLLLESGWEGSPGLRILCGGEALPRDLADELLPRCAELWNMYGPTETTIWSSTDRVGPGPDISIGAALDNTSLYVLDADQRPVPQGIDGELWIGGDGVAIGYHDRPELTAERFVADPFVDGDRMYHTGDRARIDADGRLICLGRVDHQVKIRGFRIELGEIETVLRDAPGVADAVVIARATPAGGDQLVAYVIASGVTPPSVAELRKVCATKLPDYMVPATAIVLDEFPLTENKKVARNKLPDPGSSRPDLGNVFVAPRNPTEEAVATAFASVLAVEQVGVHDSFFDLGGDSLLVMRLVNDLANRTGTRVAVHDVFGRRTVEGLAEVLDGAGATITPAAATDDRIAKRNAALAQRRRARPTR
ncbi:MAG: amino acid adenylation domain-containing protein [Actinomycetota bacterium]